MNELVVRNWFVFVVATVDAYVSFNQTSQKLILSMLERDKITLENYTE